MASVFEVWKMREDPSDLVLKYMMSMLFGRIRSDSIILDLDVAGIDLVWNF